MNDTVSRSALLAQTDTIPAPHVGRALIQANLSDRPVPYTAVYRVIVSGAVPAEQTAGNRWSIKREDLPKVAAALGLRPAPAHAAA